MCKQSLLDKETVEDVPEDDFDEFFESLDDGSVSESDVQLDAEIDGTQYEELKISSQIFFYWRE